MLEVARTRPALGAQMHLVGETLGRTLTRPTTLLYPAAKSLLAGAVFLTGLAFVTFSSRSSTAPSP